MVIINVMKIGHMTNGPSCTRPVMAKNSRWNHGSTNIIGAIATGMPYLALDERPVEGSARLSTGDIIRVGATRIAVVLIAAAGGGTDAHPDAPPDAEPLDLGDDVIARDPSSAAAFRLLVCLARSRLLVLL